MDNSSLRLRRIDGEHHFHPYTDARDVERNGALPIVRGEGIFVFDSDGKQYIEGMAGLWSVAVGFSEPRLVQAANKQFQELPYYHSFSGMTHPAVAELSDKLISIAPAGLSKAFFTNSGSEANDTAIKMIWYRANSLGTPNKKKIIARKNAYHGVTAMSASLTGLVKNHMAFDLPFPIVSHAMTPYYRPDSRLSEEEFTELCLADLQELIEREGPETIAAFIGEPVMGAGGVLPPPKGYWKGVQRLLRANDILLITDEVITGFGRTGNLFACETYNIQPDVLILSKQLSSSYQPIAAVLLSDHVYQPIAERSSEIGVFGHGFTGSGHPVAAAVALENIRIIEEKRLVENVRNLAPIFRSKLEALTAHPEIWEARSAGLMGAFEFHADARKEPGARAAAFRAVLLEKGLITRNIGDSITLCPPLIISAEELERMFDLINSGLGDFLAGERGSDVQAEK